MQIGYYVVSHKQVNFKNLRHKQIIGVGNNAKIFDINDSTGNNIAEKNPYYCELTALYWIWKNTDCDIISFEHYRRVFLNRQPIFKYTNISKTKIIHNLKKYDLILPNPVFFDESLYNQYKRDHFESDLIVTKKIINSYFPEMNDAFDFVLNSNKIYLFNMFITKRLIMNEYCTFLFKVLYLVENEIDFENRDSYQKRVFGFLSERLFNVWINYKKLKIKSMPIAMLEISPFTSFLEKVKNKIK